MKKLFILLSLVLIPSLSFAWTEPTGSTFTATAGESWEIKDIENDVHDVTHSAWTVYNISTGAYHACLYVWNGSTWTYLETSTNNMDAVGVSSPSLNTKTFLYGYNGTGWDRLRSNNQKFLVVETASSSVILSITMPVTSFMTISQFDELTQHATGFLTVSQFNELTQHSTQYLNLKQFDELTEHTTNFLNISQYDELRGHTTEYLTLSQFYELSQHSTEYMTLSQFNKFVDEFDELRGHATTYLTVSQFEKIISELGGHATGFLTLSQFDELTEHTTNFIYLNSTQYDELRKNTTDYLNGGTIDQVKTINSVLESSCVIKNFPTDYPDGTAQSSLGNIDTNTSNTYNQLKTSVTVSDKRYSNVNSSGTAGIITAATSGTITIAEKVVSYSFLYKSADGTNMIRIKNAINGDGVCLFNLDENQRDVTIPVALTFSLSNLLVGDTVQYDIGTINP